MYFCPVCLHDNWDKFLSDIQITPKNGIGIRIISSSYKTLSFWGTLPVVLSYSFFRWFHQQLDLTTIPRVHDHTVGIQLRFESTGLKVTRSCRTFSIISWFNLKYFFITLADLKIIHNLFKRTIFSQPFLYFCQYVDLKISSWLI